MRISDHKDFVAGLIFAAIGATALILALGYRMGRATAMGPGYYPALLGIVLIVLGLAATLRAVRFAPMETIARWPVVPTLAVLAGIVCFALLVSRAGLFPATVALVLCACAGRLRRHPLEVLAVAVALGAFVVGLFVYGLGLPLSAF